MGIWSVLIRNWDGITEYDSFVHADIDDGVFWPIRSDFEGNVEIPIDLQLREALERLKPPPKERPSRTAVEATGDAET